ncbi:PREDICTED: cubilin-like [Branchiostoma belcheri]|uniref:Cubilin-like n=1 Tax=Branchiostoma belcheri TaxID=7741 RepID=A0A6P4Y9N5_BRABE|nr:PREDICTED: cubilin-like [Branchiostoma belcheri]
MSKLFVFVAAFVVWTASSTVTYVAGCGGTLTAPPGGVVTSPNYPSNYGNSEYCNWLITAPTPSIIRLTFESFDTYHSSDYLLIYDGDSSGAAQMERLSGHPSSVSSITSTFNSIFLKWRTNSYGNIGGFKLYYTTLPDALHEVTAPPGGFLTSPNFPSNYDNNVHYDWLIIAPALSRIRLTFERFYTESNRDRLVILDGDNTRAKTLQSLHGLQSSVSPITSTFNTLFLRFISNGDRTYQGFNISYTSVELNYTSHSQVYLTTIGEWNFYKIPTSGPMTNANVRAACESAGLWNPCSDTGYGTCRHGRSDCVVFDGGSASCRTLNVISDRLCGNIEPQTCKPLDDTFVYSPGWQSDDSAFGVDYDTGHWGMTGADYTDKYALCVGHHEYLTTWDGWMFFKIRVLGRMSNANIQATCERLGMSFPCWYTGHDPCHSKSYWNSDCIMFDHAASADCETTKYLSNKMCGTTVDYNCPALNHTFVYYPSNSYSNGIRYGSSGTLAGSSYNDMYALCAAKQCQTSPCVHGTCAHLLDGYTCLCDEEGSGDYCDAVIDSCSSNPCMSGGTCIDEVGGYTCVCHPHTTGRNCETVLHIDKCYHFSNDSLSYKDASAVCNSMGGHLADIKDSGEQQLLASYIQLGHGVSAWTSTSTSVSSFGTCDCGDGTNRQTGAAPWMQKTADIDICLLLDSSVGYMATYQSCKEQHQYVCESNVTSCQPNVCQNGGICSSCFDNSTVFCTCPQGFIGTFCETVNQCDPNPCPFDWTCSLSQSGGIHCTVPDGIRASSLGFCSASSCGAGWSCVEDGPTGYTCIRG